ncbi:hypothetical protein [uncultured Jatrophihabitans sp.]|uniref:hypothetical protein n=1 Tax=uncultured Jatrophihabitans sp. TaxID=1610747 RepID=UPI0035CC3D2D
MNDTDWTVLDGWYLGNGEVRHVMRERHDAPPNYGHLSSLCGVWWPTELTRASDDVRPCKSCIRKLTPTKEPA